jgi:hypothetical protein
MIAGNSGTEIVGAESETIDWKSAHAELVRLAALHAALDWDDGRWLVAALRFGAHLKLGYASFVEYPTAPRHPPKPANCDKRSSSACAASVSARPRFAAHSKRSTPPTWTWR